MRGGSRVVEKLPNGSRERLQELRPQRGSSPALGSGAALPERALAACSARGGLPAPRNTLPGKSGRPGDFSRLLYQRTQLRSGWAGRACREAASPAPAEGPAAGHWAAFASQDARHTGLPRPVGQKARARRRGGGLNGGGVRGPPGRGLHGGGVRGPRLQPGRMVDGGLRAGFIPSGALPLGRRKAFPLVFSSSVQT